MQAPFDAQFVRTRLVRIALPPLLVALVASAGAARAEFRMQNGAISVCAGTFTDSGGTSGNFGNSENLVQTIWPSRPGARVSLSFTSFVTETGFDFLQIHNGHSLSAPIIINWSGTVAPQTVTSTAADGSLTLSFLSDPTGTLAGWSAGISCAPPEIVMHDGSEIACDGAFTDSGGMAGSYQNLETYELTLSPTLTGDRVTVGFSEFGTEAGTDRLAVFDGTSTSAPLIGTFSGGSLPPTVTATNGSGALHFRFISDGSVVGSGWLGFISCAHPVTTSALATCSGEAVDSGGLFGDYGSGESYVQTLYPEDAGAKIELQFFSFSTEATWDKLAIYDGNSVSAPLLGVYSGVTLSSGIITSSAPDGSLTLYWSSDGSLVASGWVAGVRCVHPIADGSVVASCSAITTDSGGLEGFYGNSEHRVQQFTRTRPLGQMKATFQSFSSESGWDYLTVRDGGPSALVLASISGNPTTPISVQTGNSGGVQTLEWTSDGSTVGPGWSGVVVCVLPLFADDFEGGDKAQWSAAAP